jgi:hypothetical protein
VHEVNSELPHHLDWLKRRPYDQGWVCSIKPEHLADELGHLKIGEIAAAWYQVEIARLQQLFGSAQGNGLSAAAPATGALAEGQLEQADDSTWIKFTQAFLQV